MPPVSNNPSSAEALPSASEEVRLGIDIGGTFTDFVIFRPSTGNLESFKLLSTPHDPALAVIQGVAEIRRSLSLNSSLARTFTIIHGSTVATNALLERKGAVTGLITTRGFRDVLQIGRQNRPELYNFFTEPPPPLVPDPLRMEVDERINHRGEVITPLDPLQVDSLLPKLKTLGCESVAVCLLFSFLHPEHENIIAEKLRHAGFFASISSEVLPEFREYERASTTAVNAYVSPIIDRYLSHLESALVDNTSGERDIHPGKIRVNVIQSNGGIFSLGEARRRGVRCILSGPAGGIVGAQYLGRLASSGLEEHPSTSRIITFDMGGTSTDVSLIDGSPRLSTESVVDGCPIHIPLLDIHTIGAGGGSIATVDLGGALRVGPESAGADPGPACYGRGHLDLMVPTVTDANLVLGRLAPEHFLGGRMPLDDSRSFDILTQLGNRLNLTPTEAAMGVIEIVNTHMEQALRLISVERGYDPHDFTLLAFGGAGGLHAADLARRLGIPKLIIPPLASTLSAFGMLAADIVKDYTQTVMLRGDTADSDILLALKPLTERGIREVQAEGVDAEDIQIDCRLDLRYTGQSYELSVHFLGDTTDFRKDFHDLHGQMYGYARPEAEIEIVNIRVLVTGKTAKPHIKRISSSSSDSGHALLGYKQVVLSESVQSGTARIRVPFYRGELLQAGNMLLGPAVVIRDDTTVLIGSGDQAIVDPYENLILAIRTN